MIAAETATSVTLKRADNASDTVLRIDIDRLKSTGLSLMPEGLEKQIDQQTMADLLEYLKLVE
jgi:putative heme-binding domain-containing protein